jgi:hypothetical protein
MNNSSTSSSTSLRGGFGVSACSNSLDDLILNLLDHLASRFKEAKVKIAIAHYSK